MRQNLDIAQNLAGVESSALARTKVFNEHLGIAPVFLTNQYNWALHKNAQRVHANQRVATDVSVLNLYDFFQDAVDLQGERKKLLVSDLEPYRAIDVPGTPDVRLYNEKGEFIAYCKRHPDDLTVSFINYLKEGVVWRRETYDTRGFLSKVDLLEKTDETEMTHESLFRPDGSTAITKRCSVKNGLATTLSLQLMNRHGRLIRQFSTDSELLVYWLNLLVAKDEKSVFVVDRCAEFFAPVMAAIKAQGSQAKVVPVIHSVHTAGDVLSGTANNFYKSVLEDIAAPDAVIVFTEAQKQDILQRFGAGNIHVIPHSHKRVAGITELSKRKRFKLVYVARFAPEKNHEMALQVFKQVAASIPNAELHLYGFGDRKQAIIDCIKEMGLQEKVFINDYVHDVGPVYREAGLSMLTSGIEGFCLGVMESLFHGCPVISFDIKYGPHSMISNGVNGFLIPFKDVNRFAEQIIQVLSDEKLHDSLVANSAASMEMFTDEAVATKWEQLLLSMEK